MPAGRTSRGVAWTIALAGYVIALVVSTYVRGRGNDAGVLHPGDSEVRLPVVTGRAEAPSAVRLAYIDVGRRGAALAPLVLIHGSPGVKEDFGAMTPSLARARRVIVPDLPGFGGSSRRVPDYSLVAEARYVGALLDRLGLPRVHLVGYSMGGGVALELTRLAPDRVASITLLSSIGVQELELFGSHRVNHFVHGVQLGVVWLLVEATPHMGRFDRMMLDLSYARSFFDSDQRPLRSILRGLACPTLIVHGREDQLVPVEAALEHYRLVAQSDLRLHDGGHFLVFSDAQAIAREIDDFLGMVDAGRARSRSAATPARLAASLDPARPVRAPLRGPARIIVTGVVALAGLGLVVMVLSRRRGGPGRPPPQASSESSIER